jgi:hypothetical protein
MLEEMSHSEIKNLKEYEEFLKERTTWGENEILKHHFSCAFV